jgi:hypothetical protein
VTSASGGMRDTIFLFRFLGLGYGPAVAASLMLTIRTKRIDYNGDRSVLALAAVPHL